MSKRIQRGAGAASQPLWLRMLALACVLLVGIASSAQAVHIHGDLLPHHDAQVQQSVDASQLPGSEASCPLCVAMHSALPVSATTADTTLVLVQVTMPTVQDRLPNSLWHFANFSRPPPVEIPS